MDGHQKILLFHHEDDLSLVVGLSVGQQTGAIRFALSCTCVIVHALYRYWTV